MPTLSTRLIAMIAGVVLILVLAGLLLRSCDQRRNAASNARVAQSQTEAAQQSAKDAIDAVGASAARETASEALTRENEKAIRAANGADQAVDPAVRDAGLAALCKRSSYANDPRCHRP